jgi:hypothetical protein
VLLGAGGGSLLGLVTAPGGGAARGLAPVEQPATSTTRRPRGHFAGVTSTSRPRRLPAATAGLRPATTRPATTSTTRPTTTTAPAPTTTRTAPTTTTTTTTIGDGTTTSSSTTVAPSTTSTTRAT